MIIFGLKLQQHDAMDFRQLALSVLEIESEAIKALASRLDDSFNQACDIILNCQGRVVVLGMGKSGHIGNKIAATLASTGTPAFFVHPGEASHGDMGMIQPEDTVILLSNSGNTRELISLIPLFKRQGNRIVALLGKTASEIAETADVTLDVSVAQEACPLNLAPTASTTAALAMGDALAVALLKARNFTEADFAKSHPGGKLGRRLLLRVSDLMHKGEAIPLVSEETLVKDAILEITSKKLGFTAVVSPAGQLQGIFTDGDLRRSLEQSIDFTNTPVMKVMSKDVKTIPQDKLAAEALLFMNENKITALVIQDENQRIQGVLHLHDLLKAGVH